jgi:hypothetical protein
MGIGREYLVKFNSTEGPCMTRFVAIAVLSVAVGVTGCGGHTFATRDADGQIIEAGWADGPPPGGSCHLLTLWPAAQVALGGYSRPEVVCNVFPVAQEGTQPLLHGENQATGDHLYTTSPTEIPDAGRGAYAFKDTCCHVYPASGSGRVPLYRLSKSGTWCHFYTTSESARDSLVTMHGWTAEGVACYVPDDSVAGAKKLYRVRRTSSGH